jgi:hypothetical protein
MFGKIKKMFSDERCKERRMKAAFHAVKVDMDLIAGKSDELKQSVNDWIIFLDKENRDLKMRVRELEKRLESFEDASDEHRLAILKSV